MSRPAYHPALLDGSLDKPRADRSALQQGINELEQREAPESGDVIAEFPRQRDQSGAAIERVQVAVKTFKGTRYLDFRIWRRTQSGSWMPTPKGVTIRARELAELQRVLAEDAGRLLGVKQ